MHSRSPTLLLGALLASTTLMPVLAQAQTAPQAEPQGEAGPANMDIVVTAQRKSERLQDIPLAVTAVSAVTAQTLGLANAIDIAAVTPSASFNHNSGFFSPYIRGIGTNFAAVGIEAPVAVYEDGAYLSRMLTVNEIIDNFDVGSIQVLRGPQGTLYGRNATGGVIIINSADPAPEFAARVRGEFGNLKHRSLAGMINVPLAEDLALRVTGGYKHDGGFMRNLTTGDKKAGGTRVYNVRAKLRWKPGNADIILGGQYYNTKSFLGAVTALGRNDSTCLACNLNPGVVDPDRGFYETQAVATVQPVRTQYYGANLSMTFDMGDFSLSSVSTFRKQVSKDSASDQDYTSLPVFEFSVPSSGGRTFTQDLQVTSQLDRPFNYIFGLSYLNDSGYFNPAFLGSAFGNPAMNLLIAAGFKNSAKTESYSAFAEGNYKLTDNLKVTFGGRYTYEERSARGETNTAFGNLLGVGGAFSFDLSNSEHAFTPRFVLAWDNGPTNIYYSFTRGFKAGGFPGPFIFPIAPVEAEKIFSHEIGIKQSLLDNRVRLSAAAFYFKNKNQQVQTLDNNSGGAITRNSGAMENYGIEVEAQVTPVEGLNLGFNGAWQHARYKPFVGASLACYDPSRSTPANPGATLYACSLDITGTSPPGAPDWSGSFNANYGFAIGSWTASLSGIAQYRSSILFTPGAGGPLGYDRDPERILVNASGYIRPPGEKLRLGFYVNNLFQKEYAALRQTSQPYGVYYEAGKPRTYGLRVEFAL